MAPGDPGVKYNSQVIVETTADVEVRCWHFRFLGRVLNFKVGMHPLAVLIQHKAKGRFDKDLLM